MLYAYIKPIRFTEVIIMKKGLSIILCALMFVLTFAACGKNDADDTPTLVDENGNAYVEVTDENGEKATSVLSDEEKSKIDENATTKKGETTAAAGGLEDLSQVASEYEALGDVNDEDLKSDKKDLITGGTSVKQTTLREDAIISKFKGSSFTLKMTLKSSSQEDMPTTVVCDGEKLVADITLKGKTVRMLIQDDGAYIILPAVKWYIKYSTDAVGGLDAFKNLGDTEDTYVGSTKVEQNGVNYICEEYKMTDGTVSKYYFVGNEWKRMEVISDDDVAIYEIDQLSSTVDSSLFSLSGYKDMTALLESMSGSVSSAS